MERKNILWLTSWYPNKYDAFDGDFIQRHAKAAAVDNDIHVIFVKASNTYNELQNNNEDRDGLTEQIIYFQSELHLFGKIFRHIRWKKHYMKAVKDYVKKHGLPHLVHVHVPWKAGLIALDIKKTYNVPFIITEHWGIYNRVAADNFFVRSPVVQRLMKRIFAESKALLSVSNYLGDSINNSVIKKDFKVIPNVVDTSLFYLSDDHQNNVFTFIHVSNMVELKNVAGIIGAFYQLIKAGNNNVRLMMVGNKNDEYVDHAEKLGLLNQRIFFTGELPYNEVAKSMQQSHCFILNSNIENAPCTISEALCCGLPVIATNVGGIPEMVNRANGLLVQSSDDEALTKAMQQVINNYKVYDRARIAADALAIYGNEAIAGKFEALYATL